MTPQILPLEDQNQPMLMSAAYSFQNPGKKYALVTLGPGIALVPFDQLEKNEMIRNRELKDYLVFENGQVVGGLGTSGAVPIPLPDAYKDGINFQIGMMEVVHARSSGPLN